MEIGISSLKWAEVNGEWCELIEIGVREWTMVLVN
jgi:hypothetical protein